LDKNGGIIPERLGEGVPNYINSNQEMIDGIKSINDEE
jgi:hypothetical protein